MINNSTEFKIYKKKKNFSNGHVIYAITNIEIFFKIYNNAPFKIQYNKLLKLHFFFIYLQTHILSFLIDFYLLLKKIKKIYWVTFSQQ